MVYNRTVVKTLDNSGARFVRCIKILNKSLRVGACPGDTIVTSIIKIIPRIIYNRKKHLKKKKTLMKGEVHKGVLVSCKKKMNRHGWQWVNVSNNLIIIINKQLLPVGSRILGPILEEVRNKKHMKIISLAPFLI